MITFMLGCTWFSLAIAGAAGTSSESAISEREPMRNWAELLDSVKDNEVLATARQSLVAAARKAAAEPILRRPTRFEQVGKGRTFYDGRTDALSEDMKPTFAFAMADHMGCNTVAGELPLIAAAYRLTGDESLKRRALDQLEEMRSWSPLQRPGWTCYLPGKHLPADGKDGAWLATGTGVRAIADTLEILPPGDVPADLRAALEALLATEIAQVGDDWQVKRPWFVRSNNTITNQWVLPTEGLVRACVFLGRSKYAKEYELGMSNMLAAFNAHGSDGEFEEGVHYASFTVTSMLAATRATAVAGDRRLLDHPYLQRFPVWVIHHLQPGRKLLNAFDCFMNSVPRHDGDVLSLLACCGAYAGSGEARWAMSHLFDGPPDTLAGLVCRVTPPPSQSPPLFAAYQRATQVNWRDGWNDDATGLWVRGGHAADQHDNQDRGHVNFIYKGKCILIEAGTPAYHNPRIHSHYCSGVGHNVLQVGSAPAPASAFTGYVLLPGWQKPRTVAPIVVNRLDASGGDVIVDGTQAYDGLTLWQRQVTWTSHQVEIRDAVSLAEDRSDQVLFRWHLGTEQPVAISGDSGRWKISWPDAAIEIESPVPLSVSQEPLPDNTLLTRPWEQCGTDHLHTCLVVRTAHGVNSANIITRVIPSP